MSAVLHFLSNVREGLVRSIAGDADESGIPEGAAATLDVVIEADGEPIVRTVGVRGPGAVVGLAPGQVLRTDPLPGAADHPPNTFPSVDLRTPALPWMFTPARPNADRLLPWLVLAVVEQRPGVELTTARSPLPVLSVDDATRELPRLEEAWAWAHAEATADPADLEALMATSPERVTSRLMCPRYLEPARSYIACVVPSFEAGRLAGLGGEPVAGSVALAWTDDTATIELPVYHSWTFRTSPHAADFEELVRRIEPMPLGPEVGVQALDISDPGSTRLPATPTERGFEGALLSPDVVVPPWNEPGRGRYQTAMAALLAEATPGEEWDRGEPYDPARHDPVVAPPRYGSLPSGIDEIPAPGARPAPSASITGTSPKPPLTGPSTQARHWLSEANLDPVHRATAGLGAEVVRRNQESLMAAAWDQAQGIARVNSLLARTRLALEVGVRATDRLTALADGAFVQLTANAHARLASDRAGLTMRGRLRSGAVPSGVVSAALRRRTRAGGTLAKSLTKTHGLEAEVTGRLTERFVDDTSAMLDHATLTVPYGAVFAPGPTADGVISTDTIAFEPADWDQVGTVHGAVLERALSRSAIGARLLERSGQIKPEVAGGRLAPPAAGGARAREVRPTIRGELAGVEIGTTPSGATADAVATADALITAITAKQAEPRPVLSTAGILDHAVSGLGVALASDETIELAKLAQTVSAQMDPAAVLSARLRAVVSPADALGEQPVPASIWVSPELRDPLYRMLVRIDPEYLLPGVGELPDDSIGLAVVNQAFVEAFLLGANHELAGEMIWREYPANLGDTWLRTFWDTRGATTVDEAPIEDILAVADWKPRALGTHATPALDPSSILVLVIKGDLLRRYPSTLITAVPARWVDDDDGGKVREEDTDGTPVPPIFFGALGGHTLFLGFQFDDSIDVDLDVPGSADPDDELPGWYFAFEQPPTEPSFGLDTAASDESPALEYWKDITWGDARGSDTDTHVTLAALDGTTLPYDERGANQWQETWGTTAAAMARITLQRPVRMLVHADQMLEVAGDGG